ncbi:hypothetical protein I3760_15G072200 [Carya illinoinensis]|nr:hypothetical protein I3760_15G072200 [Carya illinoinensis]
MIENTQKSQFFFFSISNCFSSILIDYPSSKTPFLYMKSVHLFYPLLEWQSQCSRRYNGCRERESVLDRSFSDIPGTETRHGRWFKCLVRYVIENLVVSGFYS